MASENLVIKNTGSWYQVLTPAGQTVNCKIKGNFRLKGLRTTNPVAVGDRVDITVGPEGTGFITRIESRRNYMIRRASNLSKEAHILAANLTQAALVVTLSHPATSTTFIDRFLATSEAYRIKALIIINKTDLLTDDEDRQLLDAVTTLYRSIGYRVYCVSARTGEGLDDLRDALDGNETLFSGNSGVGKSTLINALVPGAAQRVGEISDVHDQGMHTTTFSEMFPLPSGGYIIDTPGIRGFGTIEMSREEVSHYFPEIFEYGHRCRYNNCTHTHEPHCAVKEAVEEHYIAASRYASYLSILDDDDQNKYREGY